MMKTKKATKRRVPREFIDRHHEQNIPDPIDTRGRDEILRMSRKIQSVVYGPMRRMSISLRCAQEGQDSRSYEQGFLKD